MLGLLTCVLMRLSSYAEFIPDTFESYLKNVTTEMPALTTRDNTTDKEGCVKQGRVDKTEFDTILDGHQLDVEVEVVYLTTNQRHVGYLSSGNGHLAGRYQLMPIEKFIGFFGFYYQMIGGKKAIPN